MGIRIDNIHVARLVAHCVDCEPVNKIEAIKLLRNLTGLYLQGSKELVEAELAMRNSVNTVIAKAESLFGTDLNVFAEPLPFSD